MTSVAAPTAVRIRSSLTAVPRVARSFLPCAERSGSAGQELVGVDVFAGDAVVDAGGGETVVRREE